MTDIGVDIRYFVKLPNFLSKIIQRASCDGCIVEEKIITGVISMSDGRQLGVCLRNLYQHNIAVRTD